MTASSDAAAVRFAAMELDVPLPAEVTRAIDRWLPEISNPPTREEFRTHQLEAIAWMAGMIGTSIGDPWDADILYTWLEGRRAGSSSWWTPLARRSS